mmetsp:Transcript_22510/g.54130  ORF Transcript_22510/g.54130 Transcript_22510/m.54130 type:complete len:245 (+) Transcript_22510:990-1724(+)
MKQKPRTTKIGVGSVKPSMTFLSSSVRYVELAMRSRAQQQNAYTIMAWLATASTVSSKFLKGRRTAVTTRIGNDTERHIAMRMKTNSEGMRMTKPEQASRRKTSIGSQKKNSFLYPPVRNRRACVREELMPARRALRLNHRARIRMSCIPIGQTMMKATATAITFWWSSLEQTIFGSRSRYEMNEPGPLSMGSHTHTANMERLTLGSITKMIKRTSGSIFSMRDCIFEALCFTTDPAMLNFFDD